MLGLVQIILVFLSIIGRRAIVVFRRWRNHRYFHGIGNDSHKFILHSDVKTVLSGEDSASK